MDKEIKFYEQILLTWLLLFVYPPFGIILLWKVGHFDLYTRSFISLFFGLLFLELHHLYSSFIRALIFTMIIVYIVYRYHKLQDYETKIKGLLNYALNHLEIQKVLNNYLTKYSSPTKSFKDCLLYEIFFRINNPLIYKHLTLSHLEETYINIVYNESQYIINYEKNHEKDLLEILKKQESINKHYNEELNKYEIQGYMMENHPLNGYL